MALSTNGKDGGKKREEAGPEDSSFHRAGLWRITWKYPRRNRDQQRQAFRGMEGKSDGGWEAGEKRETTPKGTESRERRGR